MWRPRPTAMLQSPLLWLVLGAVAGALLASSGNSSGLQGESRRLLAAWAERWVLPLV